MSETLPPDTTLVGPDDVSDERLRAVGELCQRAGFDRFELTETPSLWVAYAEVESEIRLRVAHRSRRAAVDAVEAAAITLLLAESDAS